MSKREAINQGPLTIEELKTTAGLPVWCPDEEAYGIPFLHGVTLIQRIREKEHEKKKETEDGN